MESQQRTPRTINAVNRELDGVENNMFNLLGVVNDLGEQDGWRGHRVKDGLAKIKEMERRIKELEEERRQLYAATTASLAS